MGALDTVKELGPMATTATLSKDVIDLVSKKAELLEEQVATLEQENTVLKTENANLKQKIKDFEQQVSGSHPKDELQPEAVQILKLLFNGDSLTVTQITSALGIQKGMVEFHRDALVKQKMISLPMIRTLGRENPYHLLPAGRAYLVDRRLV